MLQITVMRNAKGWSRAELARRSRMTPGDVGKIESSRLVPYASQLRKLARALGMPRADAEELLAEVESVQSGGAACAER